MLTLLVFIAIIAVIYFVFFKKKSVGAKKQNEIDKNEDLMLECHKCGTFTSSNEAIIKDGKYFCSKECLR